MSDAALTQKENKLKEQALAWAKANRKAIAERFTNPDVYPPEEFPVSLFMAGSPGAGKTEASKALIK